MENNLDEFKKDRYDVLISMDDEKLKKYCEKYQIKFEENPKIRKMGIHIARINCNDIPEKEKNISIKWLKNIKYKGEII